MRKRIFLMLTAVLLLAGIWFVSQPPSDQKVIDIYQVHSDSLVQLVQLYQEDRVGMIVHKNGSIFPDEALDQLPEERLGLYRALMRESGVTRSLGGNPEGRVTFQVLMPIPIRPCKTLLHSPSPPPLLTSGETDDYIFAADQYRYVCRGIEENWYICLDYED